jgi:hypothetical protein
LAPATRVAAHTRLGAGVTTSRGVTRPNTVSSRPGTLTSGSVNRGSSFATTGRSTPGAVGNIHTTPRVTSSDSGSPVTHGGLHERGPAPLSSSRLSAPAMRHEPTSRPVTRHETASPHVAAPHIASPHVSHYSPPASAPSISHRSAPAAPHVSAPSMRVAPSHFSAPAMHAPAAHAPAGHSSSGGGHVSGGGHLTPSHMGGGGHSGGVPHGGGGHPAANGHGHR